MRATIRLKAVIGVTFALVIATTGVTRSATVNFVSDTSWLVANSLGIPQGTAQYVGLNATSPPIQPPGTMLYGYPSPGWPADLSSIPGAGWIWAPGITGATPSASLARYSFSRQFDLPGTPVSGSISISVDDFAEVFVNGTSVGTTGSVTDIFLAVQALSALRTFDITPNLVSGQNTIQVVTQNGPDWFSGESNPNYSLNPAGVVFGGSLSFTAIPEPAGIAVLAFVAGAGLLSRHRRGTNLVFECSD